MTTWTVTLADDQTIQVEADEITTRNDGSLWLLRSAKPPPDKLAVVLVLAAGEWSMAQPGPTPEDEPVLLPATPVPDSFRRSP